MTTKESERAGLSGAVAVNLSSTINEKLAGAGRVAHLVHSTTGHLSSKLKRPAGRHGRQTKLIGPTERHANNQRPVTRTAGPAMKHQDASQQQQQQQQQFKQTLECTRRQARTRLLASKSWGPMPACSPARHGERRPQDRQLSLKLGDLVRRSLLPRSASGPQKAKILKFTTHCRDSPPSPLAPTQASDYNKLVRDLPCQLIASQQAAFPATPRERPQTVDLDVDGGYAWIVLAVIFIINASTFGTARAYGLIFDKLAREDDKSRTEAAMPFTIMGAVENMAGPLSSYLLAQSNNSWRLTVFSGSCLITLAHLFAALTADSITGQLLSMGLMCGIGLSLVSISSIQLNNAYFVRYRSTALGLGMTGAAFGTLYISPLCQYFLDNYGTSACYLMLSAILLPNVTLSLLLKPKVAAESPAHRRPAQSRSEKATIMGSGAGLGIASDGRQQQAKGAPLATASVSQHVDELAARKRRRNSLDDLGVWLSIKRVICNPLFHLIWPTQLLFCWLNFVFGMIIVDFGRDRGLNTQDVAHLVPCWSFGQLVGRLFLSSLVDLKCLSYKSFTVICFFSISLSTCLLNSIRLPGASDHWQQASPPTTTAGRPDNHLHAIILALVFVLSMFIALLYILLNGLVVRYVEPALQPLSFGISSFTGSFFLLPRANVIGYYRDTIGNYDDMLTMFSFVSLLAALIWLLVPPSCGYLRRILLSKQQQLESRSRARDNLRVYSAWKLNAQQAPACRHGDFHDQRPQRHSHKVDLNPNVYNYQA